MTAQSFDIGLAQASSTIAAASPYAVTSPELAAGKQKERKELTGPTIAHSSPILSESPKWYSFALYSFLLCVS